MNYIEITSRNNDKIKYVRKLVDNTRERRNAGFFVCEGIRLCYDALKSGYDVTEVYITNEALNKYADKAQELCDNAQMVYYITDEVAEKLSDTVNSQGVFCVAKISKIAESGIQYEKKYVALENVQNPQNLGTVARTAEALGIDGIIVSQGCDIYNPKALRASMGSLLRIPIIHTDDLAILIEGANNHSMLTFVTVPDENAEDITTIPMRGGVVAVIGNEGNGVSELMKQTARKCVTIKMKGEAESLNASVAAVITMWEMMR